MSYFFNSSGQGNKELDDLIKDRVEKSNYSQNELNDIRLPQEYQMHDFLKDNDTFSVLINKVINLQKEAKLHSDKHTFSKSKIKNFVKRHIVKNFKWYIDPITDRQSYINENILKVLIDLLEYIKFQELIIEKLQKKEN